MKPLVNSGGESFDGGTLYLIKAKTLYGLSSHPELDSGSPFVT
ncbi:hypothetical protein [Candidatus Megaera venefica]|nr:hypothetical protein [Candidatus Megaera venefica]